MGCSLFIALKKPTFIVNLMIMSWGTLLGVFLAPYLFGLFWKRTTLAGAITMLLPLLVVPIVSLLTRPPKPEIIATAFGDKPSV